jgi:hypothetical protein
MRVHVRVETYAPYPCHIVFLPTPSLKQQIEIVRWARRLLGSCQFLRWLAEIVKVIDRSTVHRKDISQEIVFSRFPS